MGSANSVDRPGTHLNPQANVHSDPIVRSSTSSLSGEVVAEGANTRMREVSSAPSIFWHESEQGDQLHQRAVRYTPVVLSDEKAEDRFAQLGKRRNTKYRYMLK